MQLPANIIPAPSMVASNRRVSRALFFKNYSRCLAVILIASAAVKLISAFGDARVLQIPDSIFGLSNRLIYVLTATIEVGVAIVTFSQLAALRSKILLLSWLGVCFASYQSGLWITGTTTPCPCLGRAAEWWPWLENHETSVTRAITLLLCMSGLSYFLSTPKMIKAFAFAMGLSLAFSTSNASPSVDQFVANFRTLIETNSGVAMAWRIELPSAENNPVLLGNTGKIVPTGQIAEQPVCYGIMGGKDYLFLKNFGTFDVTLFSNRLDNAFLFEGGRWHNESMRYSPQPDYTNAITLYKSNAGHSQDEESALKMRCLGMFNPIIDSLKWMPSSVEGDMSLNNKESKPVVRPFKTVFIESEDSIEAHVSLHNPDEMFVLKYFFKDDGIMIPDSW